MPKADEKADHHVQGIWMASSQKVKEMDIRPGSLNICWLLNFNPIRAVLNTWSPGLTGDTTAVLQCQFGLTQ